MSKPKFENQSNESENTSSNDVNVTTTPTATVVDMSKMTKAQKEALAKTIRRMQSGGVIKKGRSIDPDSKRQKEIAAKNEKREAGLLKKGRPAYTPEQKIEAEKIKEAKRAEELAQMEALASELIANGGADEILNAK
jgi:hypothetical protein